MTTKTAKKEKAIRIKFPVRMLLLTVFMAGIISALTADLSAQRPGRQRYSEEEREAIRKEHAERIIEALDLTSEQEERLRPLLEKGIGRCPADRFDRSRESRDGFGKAGGMMRRNTEFREHCRPHRCGQRPDGSYHNGKVYRNKNRNETGPPLSLHHGRKSRRGYFHGRSSHGGDRFIERRHGHMKEIEGILTQEQIEKLFEIQRELRNEILGKDRSGDI